MWHCGYKNATSSLTIGENAWVFTLSVEADDRYDIETLDQEKNTLDYYLL